MNVKTITGDEVVVISSLPYVHFQQDPAAPVISRRSGGDHTDSGFIASIALYQPSVALSLSCAADDTQVVVSGGAYDGYVGYFRYV